MGKRKRNTVNPFKKEKPKGQKKGNPIYGVVGAKLKTKSSKKEVNLHNRDLVEELDKQLGQQQEQLALDKSRPQSKAAEQKPKKSPITPEEKSVDERVDELSDSLLLA